MKKTSTVKAQLDSKDDMRSEYQLNYQKARPNRFASRVDKDRLVVVLDSDVAKVFKSNEAVNNVLRALIVNMPVKSKK